MADPIAKRQDDLDKAYEAAKAAGLSHKEALNRAGYELFVKDLPKAPDSPIREGWNEFKKEVRKWRNYIALAAGWAGTVWGAYQTGAGNDVTRMPAFTFVVLGIVGAAVYLAGKKS